MSTASIVGSPGACLHCAGTAGSFLLLCTHYDTHKHTYTHAQTHTQTHTHTHTHTHTQNKAHYQTHKNKCKHTHTTHIHTHILESSPNTKRQDIFVSIFSPSFLLFPFNFSPRRGAPNARGPSRRGAPQGAGP